MLLVVVEPVVALRKKKAEEQQELWVATTDIAQAPRHVFYDRLNKLLSEAAFDLFVEQLAEPYYADGGRPGIAPGVYFRMLFIGYFEGIDSQRGIAWRCEDSLSLRKFLGLKLSENTPDHSSLTRIRDRFPVEIHYEVFEFVLRIAAEKKLISGTTVGVDATLLEANAAMKSIVRRETNEDWKAYIKRLMLEEGEVTEDDDPTDEELRRFDKRRKGKKVSNSDWKSPVDEDARIIRMKDGRTHMGYKAEHVVDLETEIVLSADVRHGTDADSQTLCESVVLAQMNLEDAGLEHTIEEVVADKGYHSNAQLSDCEELEYRTYIPEPASKHKRRWTDKPAEYEQAFRRNRERMKRSKGKSLQKLRSERVERSFAHMCKTGGARRTWLRGLQKTNKRYLMVAAAHNLSLVMRKLLGSGKPRGFGGIATLFSQLRTNLTHYELIRPALQLQDILKRQPPAQNLGG